MRLSLNGGIFMVDDIEAVIEVSPENWPFLISAKRSLFVAQIMRAIDGDH